MAFQQWVDSVNGKYIDVDGIYGSQCVDLILHYVQWLWPGVAWRNSIGIGNAKDLYSASNSNYFEKIANNTSDPNQIPLPGDIVVFGPTPTNAYGHIAVVLSATPSGLHLIQEDGFLLVDAQGNAHGTAAIVDRPWGRSPCIGWLRPKNISPPTNPQQGGTEVASREQVNNLYHAILFRDGDPGGLANYTGRDANSIVSDMLGSAERKGLEASYASLPSQVATLNKQVADLTTNMNTLQSQITDKNKVIATQQKMIEDLNVKLAAQTSDTSQLNAVGIALQWLIKRLGLSK
jgi:uncharacterized coiled-coil protein SlyX